MRPFIHKDFMLESETAKMLYHQYAADKPIIDYHCHLVPEMIATNYQFRNMTEIWLGGDHYKWRAMRGNGISEEYITGGKSDYEKFEKWAETLQYAMRNPLYHWTHLELSHIFKCDKVLNPSTAREIYDECNAKLATDDFRAQGLMRNCNVELVCTTDDPIDSLEYHKSILDNPFGVKVYSTWRPDKAMAVEDAASFNLYLDKLEAASNISITSYPDLLRALKSRHDFFHDMGCRLSDHGLEKFYAEDYSDEEIATIFDKVREGYDVNPQAVDTFKSAMLIELAKMDYAKGWTQQFHIGAIRNNSPRMFRQLGADTGFDAIHDIPNAAAGHKFFGRLDDMEALGKTIIYNLNPADNDLFATMAYTFNNGSTAGQMQYGSGWWFLDQEVGMVNQLNSLSVLGLLSRFVGMLTDSRSFLSYPRHDYFRRILCNLLGKDLESGKLPLSEIDFIGKMVGDISYNNAKNYLKL